jgi:hypothetical protein
VSFMPKDGLGGEKKRIGLVRTHTGATRDRANEREGLLGWTTAAMYIARCLVRCRGRLGETK